ncbi:hypothetical protein MA16_Dca021800 [Dendrobium catenatum]|uniref:Uncharacterized protein n=1 Tax=Dendrobium catenatum TaxID=906689 RepID=A0A2I0WXW3_9ASPA|nr:hypothetical protein MA16_Dca021800 [Dendrobium catenatum]
MQEFVEVHNEHGGTPNLVQNVVIPSSVQAGEIPSCLSPKVDGKVVGEQSLEEGKFEQGELVEALW